MPAFRVGKPRVALGFATPYTHAGTFLNLNPIPFDTVVWSEPMYTLTTPGVIDITHTGTYALALAISAYPDAFDAAFCQYGILVNGGTVAGEDCNVNSGGAFANSSSVQRLQAGDAVTAYILGNGGSTPWWMDPSPLTQFSCTRLGPERWT